MFGLNLCFVVIEDLSLMYSEFISTFQASYTSTLKVNVQWMVPELFVEREDGSQVRPSEQSDMYSFGGVMLQVRLGQLWPLIDDLSSTCRSSPITLPYYYLR
ncbi:uncharacterized protein EDB93DRAFT_99321 [Suillus bovinus]|uniref:uncharacterized protein n=1 Tax=Suillus bovinus TaxID=48563 RepID=UPI001B86CE32|nr:uncharacterized protein EDB93DRAFT_99321 [Suillus bovinus]KAG2155293.1 hypothetical protein EDB93DRAFT_99321 [Suillus bovinus]